MKGRLKELATDARLLTGWVVGECEYQKFAELIIRECLIEIETYQIPVGNSPAGEMASEWTCDALKEIRDNIKEKFGMKIEVQS